MPRALTLIVAALVATLAAATGALAARKPPRVDQTNVAVCAPSAKNDPAATGHGNSGNGGNAGGNSGASNGVGGGNGSAENPGQGNGNGNNTTDPTTSETPGNGNGNGGGGGANAGGGNPNAGGANPNAGPGNNNAGGNGNGRGNENANAAPACVTPPADPPENAIAGDGALPPAVAGKTFNVEATSGAVLIDTPGAGGWVGLEGSDQLPTGTVVDTRAGAVELTSSAGSSAQQQTAAFSGAKFEVRQAPATRAVTELVLRGGGDFKGCPRIGHDRRAQQIRNGFISARAKGRRGLWGSGHGRFRTRGRWGSATVRGTVWGVEDTCEGTRTTVLRGVVEVADFGLNDTVSVTAGQSYLAKTRP